MNKDERKFKIITGVYGAIQASIILKKELYKYTGEPLTEEIEKELETEVKSWEWVNGMYRIGGENGYIEYLGKYE